MSSDVQQEPQYVENRIDDMDDHDEDELCGDEQNNFDGPEQHDDLGGEFNDEGQFDQSSIPVDYTRFHSGIGINVSNVRMSVDDSGLDYREHSDVYPSLRKVPSHQSVDDSYYADLRMQKIAQKEATIREELFRECTFRPKIKNLPATYGPLKENGTPFVDRVIKWEKEKKAELEHKAKLAVKETDVECTFKPHINKNSALAAKEIHKDSSEPVSERLFRSYMLAHENRQKLIEQELQKEQMLAEQQCTFKPQLKTKSNPQFQHVQSKVRHVMNNPNALKPKTEESPPKDCSFKPKINKIRPEMSSAKLYVSTNVVERLTKPITTEQKKKKPEETKTFDDSFEVVDAATFIGSLQSGSQGFQTPGGKSLRSKMRASAGSNESPLSNDSHPPKQRTSVDFEAFIERQNIRNKQRDDKLKKAAEAITPKFKPKISSKSKEIIQSVNGAGGGAAFLDRVQKEIEKRKEFEQKIELMVDKDCTFTPNINKKAALKPSRSRTELSLGDKFKHEAKLKMLQIEIEQETQANLTFKPELSKKGKEVQGKLSIIHDNNPNAYLEWIKLKRQEQEKERIMEQKRREDEEAQECTFAPRTTQCPAYIKRIAESISKMKSARGPSQERLRPDWK